MEGINIRIDFKSKLTEELQNSFWDSFIAYIEEYNLMFGGGHSEKYFEGYLNTSENNKLSSKQLIDVLKRFIEQNATIINTHTLDPDFE